MLALIAGTGALPGIVARAQTQAPIICALKEHTPPDLTVQKEFRLETLGTLLADLKAAGVQDVCFVGAIRRPSIDPTAIDDATLPLLATLKEALGQGDDGALRAVLGLFEQADFKIRSAAELVSGLLPPAGVLSQTQPSDETRADAKRAASLMRRLSRADVGQACAVKKGQVLSIEGFFGTDWMLQSLVQRTDGVGGLLFKAPKSGQDRRIDLPTIGPETVDAAARAGLDGIVIEAGGVIVLDREEVCRRCDESALFLWVRDEDI